MTKTIKSEPFQWNEPMAQLALEDFDAIREKLPYCAAQSIGMALAKLEILEKQGARVAVGNDNDFHFSFCPVSKDGSVHCDVCGWVVRARESGEMFCSISYIARMLAYKAMGLGVGE